jgi:hypothetical protein
VIEIPENEVNDLIATLNDLVLPEKQRALLDAIIKVVSDIREYDGPHGFETEFNDAFTKAQADIVLNYVTSPGPAAAILRSVGTTSAGAMRNPGASPAGIIKAPAAGPSADVDENDDDT